jgi:hypothetical protein
MGLTVFSHPAIMRLDWPFMVNQALTLYAQVGVIDFPTV